MKKQGYYKFFSLYIKNEWNNLLLKKQRSMLNREKRYYRDNIEVLREKARNKYRGLSEEEKNRKREYGRNRYYRRLEEPRQGD